MKNLKVLIIDDEQRAIHALTRVLANFSQVEIVGTFLDALSARAFLAQHSVDCLFVDIEMPELDGLSFAKEVKRLTPDTHIVFTTAYVEHAIDAFEMASLDYLLKPVTVDRMENTISRLIQRMRVEVIPSFMIITTPTLVIHVPSQNHAPLRWRTEKAKQVFLYLLLHANQPVLRDTLTDIFWDGFAQQKAAGQLHTTVYLIRKLCAPLEQSLEILSRNGTYTLTIATNLVDFLTLRNVVDGVLQGTRVLMPADLALFESFCADLLTDVTDIWVETYRAEVDFLLQGISKFLKSNAVFYVNNRPLRIACDAFLGKYERLFREDNA